MTDYQRKLLSNLFTSKFKTSNDNDETESYMDDAELDIDEEEDYVDWLCEYDEFY